MTGKWRAPSLLSCSALLLALKAALRFRGFSWTLWWIRQSTAASERAPQLSDSRVAVVEERVALAGALYPGRAACLEQSLVLYYLLRRLGLPVEFRLGVQAHPFLAHAWIECDGRPVNDIAEHVRWFTPLSARSS